LIEVTDNSDLLSSETELNARVIPRLGRSELTEETYEDYSDYRDLKL